MVRRYENEHTKHWSAIVDRADAVVFVTPEYNHGYPATLKNALDYLHQEWAHKPVGFVSYGGVAGGTRSVQQLKSVVAALKLLPLTEAVTIPFVASRIDDGVFHADEPLEQAATIMLDELVATEDALRGRRLSAAVPAAS